MSASAPDALLLAHRQRLDRLRQRQRLLERPLHEVFSQGGAHTVRHAPIRAQSTHSFRATHALPPLAELQSVEDPSMRWPIHGLRQVVGRYHPPHGPVDIALAELLDHERLRLGPPHALIEYKPEQERWVLRPMTSRFETRVGDHTLGTGSRPHPLDDGTLIRLGVVSLRFVLKTPPAQWQQAHKALFEATESPSLWLNRHGGPCGTYWELSMARVLLGATRRVRADLDLHAHLLDPERCLIASHHGVLWRDVQGGWLIKPCAEAHSVYVNRVEVLEPTSLQSGDEVALGNTSFCFHQPDAPERTSRPDFFVPVDWHREHTKPADVQSLVGPSQAEET